MYTCKVCGKIFSWQSGLSRHSNVHKDYPRYQCTLCHTTFIRKDNLKYHLQGVHGSDEMEISNQQDNMFNKLIEKHGKLDLAEVPKMQQTHYGNIPYRQVYSNEELNHKTTNGNCQQENVKYCKTDSVKNSSQKYSEHRQDSDEIIMWDNYTNPNDLVNLIKICKRVGLPYQIYINTLRDMKIIK